MYYKLGKAYLTNWGSFVSSKIRAVLLQIGTILLLQIGASVVTNLGRYYKLGKP